MRVNGQHTHEDIGVLECFLSRDVVHTTAPGSLGAPCFLTCGLHRRWWRWWPRCHRHASLLGEGALAREVTSATTIEAWTALSTSRRTSLYSDGPLGLSWSRRVTHYHRGLWVPRSWCTRWGRNTHTRALRARADKRRSSSLAPLCFELVH